MYIYCIYTRSTYRLFINSSNFCLKLNKEIVFKHLYIDNEFLKIINRTDYSLYSNIIFWCSLSLRQIINYFPYSLWITLKVNKAPKSCRFLQ